MNKRKMSDANKTPGYTNRRAKVFWGIVILLLVLSLYGLFAAPKLNSDSTDVMNDIATEIIKSIENDDSANIKKMFMPDKQIDDQKLKQFSALYRGSMVSFERFTKGTQRSSMSGFGSSKDYMASFLVTTTESTYELIIGWAVISEKDSGIYYLSLRTEDTIVLP